MNTHQYAADVFQLAQTQRRFAHEYKRWAVEYQQRGDGKRYEENRAKSDRLWQSAKFLMRGLRGWSFKENANFEWKDAAE